jgi:signal transduction histidine kinase
MLWSPDMPTLLGGTPAAPAAVVVPLKWTLLLMAGSAAGVWGLLAWRRRWIDRRNEAASNLEQQREQADLMRRRSRTLERILAVSARFGSTRNLQELHTRIVDAVQDIGGFHQVVLYLWSDGTRAYAARAFAGIPDGQMARLSEKQVGRADFEALCDVRFRYSNCYLKGLAGNEDRDAALAGVVQPAAEPSVPAWPEGQELIAPLISIDGVEMGYLSLGDPAGGQVPGVVDIRLLEFLVQQAATAIETAEVFESLARNNAELQLASEKLNSLNDMKNNFVANVSHELRTPLTSISAYAELLQQNMGGMSEEVRHEFLRVIHTESLKLTDIINDILELGNIENGRPRENQVEVDLVALTQRLGESWKTRAHDMGIRLELQTTSPALPIYADGILLQQMLGHLLSNAFKFTDGGGRVTVKVQETGTAARLVVEDTGIGIPHDQLDEIFDRFYQVDGSATREHNGQGVGLSICQDIVHHHDGRIWAENVEPCGARITVLLPRRPAVLQPVDTDAVSGSPFQPGEFMQRVLHWVSESLGVRTATLMMPDAAQEFLTIRAAIGLSEAVVQSARVRRGAGFAGRVWDDGPTLLIDDITAEDQPGKELNEPRYTTRSLLCVPLLENGRCLGVLAVNNRIDGRPLDDDDRLLLEGMAPMLTAMIIRHRVWQDDSRHFRDVRDTLRAITGVGNLHQESLLETCQEICLAAARRIMMPEEDLEHLAFALQFYDVGLAFVPYQLLNKPGPLDPPEEQVVRRHVQKCLEVLEPLDPDSKVRQLILHHHENVDGSGYPVGLAGEAIPLGSRLLRLTDTLAALLSPRPWRPAFTLDQAVREIRSGTGTRYCPRMAEIFLAETELRRPRLEDQQQRGADHRVFKRPVLDPVSL